MDVIHTCCVTGHRDIPENKTEAVRDFLRREILFAIGDGYTHFISGFAAGTDLIFAELVAEMKETYPITLEAAVPYRSRMYTSNKTFRRLINLCDVIKVHSEEYSKTCYMVRNRYMVDSSNRVIAVYDGREAGGTAATVNYARKFGKEIAFIDLENDIEFFS